MSKDVHARRYTEEELLRILKELTKELGYVPTTRELEIRADLPSTPTYIRRFGSWQAALEVAGLNMRSGKYTDEELLEALRKLAKEFGRKPKLIEVDIRKDMPSGRTYIERFGSWSKALEVAGL